MEGNNAILYHLCDEIIIRGLIRGGCILDQVSKVYVLHRYVFVVGERVQKRMARVIDTNTPNCQLKYGRVKQIIKSGFGERLLSVSPVIFIMFLESKVCIFPFML